MGIEITNQTSSTVTEETYEFTFDGTKYIYKEFIDGGKVIDVVLRYAENGEDANSPEVLEAIQTFIDEKEGVTPKQNWPRNARHEGRREA